MIVLSTLILERLSVMAIHIQSYLVELLTRYKRVLHIGVLLMLAELISYTYTPHTLVHTLQLSIPQGRSFT